MRLKDKAYEQHLAEHEKDRPKDFGVDESRSIQDYVARWCELNGLRHDKKARKLRKRRT